MGMVVSCPSLKPEPSVPSGGRRGVSWETPLDPLRWNRVLSSKTGLAAIAAEKDPTWPAFLSGKHGGVFSIEYRIKIGLLEKSRIYKPKLLFLGLLTLGRIHPHFY